MGMPTSQGQMIISLIRERRQGGKKYQLEISVTQKHQDAFPDCIIQIELDILESKC